MAGAGLAMEKGYSGKIAAKQSIPVHGQFHMFLNVQFPQYFFFVSQEQEGP